jgi:hypothetical protein
MWRASDLVECLIFIGLALLLAYTVFVTVRFFRRYFLGRRKPFVLFADCTPSSEQSRKNFVADLSRGVGTLQSIAFAAPFLGLAGTYYGILCLFARGWFWSFSWWSPIDLSVALIATAAGLIVALPAAISYNVLRICLEKFEHSGSSTLLTATPCSYGFAQTLPLRRRFSGPPAFALIAAPILALLILMVALMLRPRTSTGLPVHLLRIGVSDHYSEPIIVRVVGGNASFPVLYVNSKETEWGDLDSTLRSRLKARPPRWTVYVEGGNDVPWMLVTYVIDVARGLRAEVVLLTSPPRIDSSHSRKARTKKKVKSDTNQGLEQEGKKLKGP